MAHDVNGMQVAVLATDGVEQVELTEPVKALKQAGATVTVVSLKAGEIQGMNHDEKGDKLPVDKALSAVKPEQFDALALPGGVANPRLPSASILTRWPSSSTSPRAASRSRRSATGLGHWSRLAPCGARR